MANGTAMDPRLSAFLKNISSRLTAIEADQKAAGSIAQIVSAMKPPRSVTQDIDAIDGRRIFYNLNGVISFTAADKGTRGQPITLLVSQDGPFIMTHYPLAWWLPNAPSPSTNFGRWSPVTSTPLPTQQFGANIDIIDISYELVDGGSQRNFQNAASPPVLSRIDNLVPLPVPTLFTPNATVQFYPTYQNILFAAGAAVPTTGGSLVVALPGYRIVNL